MKNTKLPIAVVILILATGVMAWAHPYSISCPVDGLAMHFDHQVGYGANAVCWYSHQTNDTHDNGRTVTHEAYIPCGD